MHTCAKVELDVAAVSQLCAPTKFMQIQATKPRIEMKICLEFGKMKILIVKTVHVPE